MRGSCLCEGVVFECDGEPAEIELCHCRRCRKACGTSPVATLLVAKSSYRVVRGEELIRTFELPIRESPPPYARAFCVRCGGPVPMETATDQIEIPAGLVDDDPGVRPARHIFTAVAAPWHDIADDLPRYPGRPPRGRRGRSRSG